MVLSRQTNELNWKPKIFILFSRCSFLSAEGIDNYINNFKKENCSILLGETGLNYIAEVCQHKLPCTSSTRQTSLGSSNRAGFYYKLGTFSYKLKLFYTNYPNLNK